MRFEWDPDKARSNLVKHGVTFEDAEFVWEDPLRVIRFDSVQDYEERWRAIGAVGPVALIIVIHIYPDATDEDRVRIISARRATAHERRQYEQENT
jgi:hypothetical protein